jgi:hypothetical protein
MVKVLLLNEMITLGRILFCIHAAQSIMNPKKGLVKD